MKKLIYHTIIFIYFSLPTSSIAQISDSIEIDSNSIIRCKSNMPSNLANIGNMLFANNMLLTDCWHNNNSGYDHFVNLKFFNKEFNTKIFENIFEINFLCIYPRSRNCCEYIKIKEWCFSTKAESLEAINILQNIRQAGIVFKRPTYWMFIEADGKVYFIESNDYDLQSKYMLMVKNIIIQSSESVLQTIVEFPK